LPIKDRRLILVVSLIVITSALAYGLGWSKILAVDSISITGTEQSSLITSQLVAGESKIRVGEPLARINPRTESNLIEDLEWIAGANVSRNWWSGEVKIQITERVPVAVFKESLASNDPKYLTSDGVEFSSPQKFSNLAEISLGQSSKSERRRIASFVSHLPPGLVGSLLGLEISTDREIGMQMSQGKKTLSVNWGAGNSATDIAVKSKVLVGLLALPENKKISEVDLSIANSPIVR